MPNSHVQIGTDVLIVGGGPHGLAVAARLVREQKTGGVRLDNLSAADHTELTTRRGARTEGDVGMRVRVLDCHGTFMSEWDRNFTHLHIPHLRSPATAHPCPDDSASLLAFAAETGRTDELVRRDDAPELALGKKTKKKKKGKGKGRGVSSAASEGDFARPSSALFSDFCRRLSSSLADDLGEVIRDHALHIHRQDDGTYLVQCTQCNITARSVVLACGNVGRPRLPDWAMAPCVFQGGGHNDGNDEEERALTTAPRAGPLIVHTSQLHAYPSLDAIRGSDGNAPVAVVGAGMTGCWLALALARAGRRVTLVARSGLRVQAYDTSDSWATARARGLGKFNFYQAEAAERAAIVREARGQGHGTVTPDLGAAVRRAAAAGEIDLVEGDPAAGVDAGGLCLASGRAVPAGAVVLATGTRTDCTACNLFRAAFALVGGVSVHEGFPALGDDLRLHEDHDVFVVGALAALAAGPDAHNLSGARHCSRLVADALLGGEGDGREEGEEDAHVHGGGNAFALLGPGDDE